MQCLHVFRGENKNLSFPGADRIYMQVAGVFMWLLDDIGNTPWRLVDRADVRTKFNSV